AAPVWREVMAWLHQAVASPPPAPAAGVVAAARPGAGAAEWFLAGTEPVLAPAASAALGADHPRIVSPVAGTVIALDPDLPPSRQRVVFEGEGRGAPYRWRLDATDLGDAGVVLWEPVSGRHALALVDPSGRVVESTRFEVRGPGPAAAE